MRILFVNSGLGYGGAETQLIAIMGQLRQLGHETALYTLTKHVPRASELTEQGIQLVVDEKRSKLDRSVVRRLRAFIRQWKPDLLHGFLFDANIYSRLAGIGTRIPVVNSERSDAYRMTALQSLTHIATRWRVDCLVANSHSGRAFSQRVLGYRPTKTAVVWNGIRLAQVDERCKRSSGGYRQEFFGRQDVKVAVLVGSIKPEKDHLLALDVAEALADADPQWRVLFVGAAYDKEDLVYANANASASSDLKSSVDRRWRSSPHRDRIVFTGQRKDALEIIADSDVLFCTSTNEGFPNVVMEAMAVGTPVVSAEYSDIRRILEDPAWIVASREPAAMSTAISKVASERRAIGARLRRWIEDNATIEHSVQDLIKIYTGLIQPR